MSHLLEVAKQVITRSEEIAAFHSGSRVSDVDIKPHNDQAEALQIVVTYTGGEIETFNLSDDKAESHDRQTEIKLVIYGAASIAADIKSSLKSENATWE